MSGWEEYPLDEVIDKFIDYRGKTPTKTSSGIPLITAKIVKGGFIQEPEEFIAGADYDAWMRRGLPHVGDVVLTTEAPLGEVAQINAEEKVALAQRIITLRGKQEVLDNTFLRYSLQGSTMQYRLTGRASGSTVQGIKSSELKKVLIPLPEIGEQRSIAEILSSLDEKIELNRNQNRTLEAIAQALFKRWFVEFESPFGFAQGKPDESGRPYKSSGGAMQPSGLGEMEHVPLFEVVELNPRCQLKKGQLATYVDMKALPTFGMSVSEVIEKEFSGGSKFMQNVTLLARITPCLENGKTAYVDFLGGGEVAFGSTEFIVMRAKVGVSPQFVYCLARDPFFRQYAIKSMVGSSGRQRVQVDQIAKFPVPFPGQELMQWFDEATKPLFDKISSNRKESFTLAKLRDTLLPKLMSGELRLSDDGKRHEATV